MRFWQVQCYVSHESSDAIAALLQDFPDIQGVQLEGIGELQVPHPEYGEWFDEMIVPTDRILVSVYFPESYEETSIRDRIQSVIRQVQQADVYVTDTDVDIVMELVDDSSWLNAWKEHAAPIPIGQDLVIVPTWSLADLPESLAARKPIIIEPGMAFGTGTHQTTQLCAQALAELPISQRTVLDVGTGTGVLAIAAGRLGASRVQAIDIDPIAVQAARENVERNQLSDLISVEVGNLLSGFAAESTFDVVIANILRDIVILLIPQVAVRMESGGHLLTSGFIDTQAPAVEASLQVHGFSVKRRYQQDDWMALLAVKN